MKKLINRYVVANTRGGLIAYDEKDYDKVIEGLDYESPKEITRFKNWKKAFDYCKKHGEEYFCLEETDFTSTY